MGEITVLTKATSKSKLRTTISMGIVKQFNLSEEDKLDWEIRASRELIVVKPLKGVRK